MCACVCRGVLGVLVAVLAKVYSTGFNLIQVKAEKGKNTFKYLFRYISEI